MLAVEYESSSFHSNLFSVTLVSSFLCCLFFFCLCSEVIVSVGIFRVFGSELAELPLVATSKDCQGQVISLYLEPYIFFFFTRGAYS